VGLLDALLGRSKRVEPDLDALFALPTAALTLQTAAEMHPTDTGAVCFRGAEGGPFARMKDEITELLDGQAPEETQDDYGYTWIAISSPDMATLCTNLHAVNSTLESRGWGPSLLCTTVGFRADDGGRLALVYLYKQGTFYPFAPVDARRQQRDNALELQARAAVSGDLPIESDVKRWFPVWGAPGV